MNWQEILTILVPLLALMAWVYSRIEKKADERQANLEKRLDKFENHVDQRFAQVDQRFAQVEQRFNQVDQQLQGLDRRLTRLEVRFDERGYWESREFHKTGTEDKK